MKAQVVASLDEHEGDLTDTKVEIHAGGDYRHPVLVDALIKRGALILVPVTEPGIGAQINEYKKLMSRGVAQLSTKPHVSEPASSVRKYLPTKTRGGGSYVKLSEFLTSCNDRSIQLTFLALEKILGRPLPNSARTHRAWWVNEESGTHSHARSWMTPGWKVEHVDFNQQIVRFYRVR